MKNADLTMTPAGLQKLADVRRRRWIAATLSFSIYLALLFWLGTLFQHVGWSAIDIAIFTAFAIAAPWSVLGVCNGMLGLWLLHLHPHGLACVAPFTQAGGMAEKLRSRTAMLMTIRNEDVLRAFARLAVIKASVDATGEADLFDWFILSDTDDLGLAAQEDKAFANWVAQTWDCTKHLHYRRRNQNIGYKAGNIRDFCERFGARFEFMIPLDADSLMDGQTILRLVRIGEAYPRLGILQSLVVGAPSTSAFARIFQFGMRHGMRTYTMGAAWWAADCGPYWGHNALVRVAPFTASCDLPKLKGDRHILSHDQIEAALMRRAGFEVRVLPIESGSYEDNPPNLLEFSRRDLRWCQGNMQYLKLLAMPRLLPTSRFQLLWAISMFIGVPASTSIVGLVALMPLTDEELSAFPPVSTPFFYIVFLGLYLAAKLAGFLDVALTPGGVRRYGGALPFAAGACLEIVFSFLLTAATSLSTSLFMLGLLFNKTIGWIGQARDVEVLSWQGAARGLWPQLVFGGLIFAIGALLAPNLLLWSLPLTLGYVLAIPFAKLTASPQWSRFLARIGLCAVPEDVVEPAIFKDLHKELAR
jgi:membrane glycosyltransferase